MSHQNRALLLLALLVLLSSCGGDQLTRIESETLFSMPLGRMENHLDAFRPYGLDNGFTNEIYMQNGIFYVSNGVARKVMEFSSYGDLLSILYNPQFNPRPLGLLERADQELLTNRSSVAFPIRAPGSLAVTTGNTLLVESQVAEEQAFPDDESNPRALYTHVVQRFDAQGTYLDSLGQEGIGGSPLPFIVDIQTTELDEIVVITQGPEAEWYVFWYWASGRLRYRVELPPSRLPRFSGEELAPHIAAIYPDKDLPILYVLLYNQQDIYDRFENPAPARVAVLDLRNDQYTHLFDVPNYQLPTLGRGDQNSTVYSLYSMVGTIKGGRLVFMGQGSVNGITPMLIMNPSGQVVDRFELQLDLNEAVRSEFSLSSEGVLSALMTMENEAQIRWWRTDRFIF